MNHLKWVSIAVLFLVAVTVSPATAANIEHVVRKGDTIYHISRLYGVPVDVILEMNNIPDARSLKVGTKLEIPQTYRVKKGDTLYSIARDNGIPLSELVSVNHIDKNHLIRIGEALVLPFGSHTAQRVAENTAEAKRSDSQPTQSPSDSPSVSAAPSARVSASGSGDPFWPAEGNRVFLTGKLSGGTQISGNVGDPVFAVAAGRVVWVGPYRGYGRVVFVESPENYIYVYGGNETTLVKVGDTVTPGTQVANMGINPHLGHACAYFFVYKNGKPIDPNAAPRG